MKKYYSIIACLVICLFLIQHRYSTLPENKPKTVVTTWDAFGYYLYLPAIIIYKDYKDLKWVDSVNKKYNLTGGNLYQAGKAPNDNYVFKYLGGVALLQIPFFILGHVLAPYLGYVQDGFSAPYQFSIIIAALFYALLGLVLLRKVLSYYFNDSVIAVTLLLLYLATNLPQYAAVDSGMSHIYIFPLYSLVLLFTIKWHNSPNISSAIIVGFVIGLATICRPTEAVMLFIPLLWHMQNKDATKQKWQLVKQNKKHIFMAILFGLFGILPQLIYWKFATDTWIFDVGSAWDFLTPHLRVLFGWEKGWFIYTPITIFFIIGMFLLRKQEFKKSIIWFCLLNIYIIIAWRDWQYGGSYSTRALVQSYPVFALPFAAMVQHIQSKKWSWLFYIIAMYLIGTNIFQLYQYKNNILHYRDMNREYYSAIYLDNDPTPIDMTLLESNDIIPNISSFSSIDMYTQQSDTAINLQPNEKGVLFSSKLSNNNVEQWVVIKAEINISNGFWESYLNTELRMGDSTLQTKTRLFSPISNDGLWNSYELHSKIPKHFHNGVVTIFVSRELQGSFSCSAKNISVKQLVKY